MVEWDYKEQTALLKTTMKNKPVGPQRLTRLTLIAKLLSSALSTTVTKKEVSAKLDSWYDLLGLEALEDSTLVDGSSSSEGEPDEDVRLTRSSTRKSDTDTDEVPRTRKSTRKLDVKQETPSEEESSDPESHPRKRTRSTVQQAPAVKLLRASITATPSTAARRNTRSTLPHDIATPSKPPARQRRATLSTPMANVVQTPSLARRRSSRKK